MRDMTSVPHRFEGDKRTLVASLSVESVGGWRSGMPGTSVTILPVDRVGL